MPWAYGYSYYWPGYYPSYPYSGYYGYYGYDPESADYGGYAYDPPDPPDDSPAHNYYGDGRWHRFGE